MQTDYMISVAVVLRNDAAVVEPFVEEAIAVLGSHYSFYEILFVDLSSTDNTISKLKELMLRYPNLRLIRLANCTQIELGHTAALEHVIGDHVILMDPYLDSPQDIPRLVKEATSGIDMVVVHRVGGPRDRLGRKVYYRLAGYILGRKLNPDESDFRLMTRKAVSGITKMKDRRRHLRYFAELLGFKKVVVDCQVHPRAAQFSRRTGIIKSVRRCLDLVISNSAVPLRLAAGLGMLAAFVSLLYLFYTFVIATTKTEIAPGWLSTSVMLSTMFFCMFLIMSILAEYVARILDETKERPLYFIEHEDQSTVSTLKNQQILNVVEVDA